MDLPLVDWASLSERVSDLLLPGLDLAEDGEDFDGLEEPLDFKLSSGDLGLFGEPIVVFDWLMFPETSFGLDGFFNFKPSLGKSKIKF